MRIKCPTDIVSSSRNLAGSKVEKIRAGATLWVPWPARLRFTVLVTEETNDWSVNGTKWVYNQLTKQNIWDAIGQGTAIPTYSQKSSWKHWTAARFVGEEWARKQQSYPQNSSGLFQECSERHRNWLYTSDFPTEDTMACRIRGRKGIPALPPLLHCSNFRQSALYVNP